MERCKDSCLEGGLFRWMNIDVDRPTRATLPQQTLECLLRGASKVVVMKSIHYGHLVNLPLSLDLSWFR